MLLVPSYKLIVICILLFVSSALASATSLNKHNISFTHLDTRSLDYSIAGVQAIAQDQTGFIWLASVQGLVRFDGHEFVRYLESDANASISGDLIRDLAIDNNGVLWVATNKGVDTYHPETDSFVSMNSALGFTDGEVSASAIAVNENNQVLIGSYRGLYIYDQENKTHRHFDVDGEPGSTLSANSVTDIVIDAHQQAWVSTSRGVNQIQLSNFEIRHFFTELEETAHSIMIDRHSNLWVGLYGGGAIQKKANGEVIRYLHSSTNETSIGSDTVLHIYEDQNGNIWFATDHGGLNLYQPQTDSFLRFVNNLADPNSISSNQTQHVFQDLDNNLWVSTFTSGINLLNLNSTAVETFNHDPNDSSSINDNAVLSLYQSQDKTIWVGTEKGLNSFDKDKRTFTRYSDSSEQDNILDTKPVLAIQEDENGNLWLGTWSGGLDYFDRKQRIIQNYFPEEGVQNSLGSKYIWSLMIDKSGDLWVGTQTNGLNKFDKDSQTFARFPKIGNTSDNSIEWYLVFDIIMDEDGILWAVTLNGLFIVEPNTNTFKQYEHNDKLSSLRGLSAIRYSNGDIWLGTQDGGINIIDVDTNEVSYIQIKDGLPSNKVTGLFEDSNNNVWATTVNGLVLIDVKDSYKLYTVGPEQGVMGTQFNRNAIIEDENQTLYVGGVEGLNIIQINKLSLKSNAKPVKLTNILINHVSIFEKRIADQAMLSSPLDALEELNLNYKENSLSFYFSKFSFRNSNKASYLYRLKGFEPNWLSSRNKPFVNYTNLDPGDYTFEVKRDLANNELNGIITQLKISISPPWWRSTPAYLFYIMFATVSIYLICIFQKMRINAAIYKKLSMHDPLTQLYNRHGIESIIKSYFNNEELKNQLTVLVIDIDHFKQINDTYGHEAGDTVIKNVGRIIKYSLRKGDHIARWGGEEFIALTPKTTLQEAKGIAEKIRATVASTKFDIASESKEVTVSIGFETCQANEDFNSLFNRADASMYKAKANGRNQIYSELIK